MAVGVGVEGWVAMVARELWLGDGVWRRGAGLGEGGSKYGGEEVG